MHTTEPLVLDTSPIELKIFIAKLKRYKSSGSDQTVAELIQAGGKISRPEIHKLIDYIRNKKNVLIGERSLLLYQFTRTTFKLTAVIIVG
jgi:hypothetical protein